MSIAHVFGNAILNKVCIGNNISLSQPTSAWAFLNAACQHYFRFSSIWSCPEGMTIDCIAGFLLDVALHLIFDCAQLQQQFTSTLWQV